MYSLEGRARASSWPRPRCTGWMYPIHTRRRPSPTHRRASRSEKRLGAERGGGRRGSGSGEGWVALTRLALRLLVALDCTTRGRMRDEVSSALFALDCRRRGPGDHDGRGRGRRAGGNAPLAPGAAVTWRGAASQLVDRESVQAERERGTHVDEARVVEVALLGTAGDLLLLLLRLDLGGLRLDLTGTGKRSVNLSPARWRARRGRGRGRGRGATTVSSPGR